MKTLIAWAGASLIALATLGATAPDASARSWHHRHHHGFNGGAELGIGLLSGVIIGGALAAPYYNYPPAYDYDPYPYRGRYAPYPTYRYYRSYPSYRSYYPSYRTYDRPRSYYRVGGGDSHVRWCYARYRSYRAWDNTFQPYHGPRRACLSPYD